MMLKACTGGYDGKGNAVITTAESIEHAFESLGRRNIKLIVEALV